MLHTPLHLIWAGGEAVFVFFVLSGFVLALPSVSGRQVPWRSYYPSRLVRLYVPITVAVAFAYVLVRLVPRKAGPRSSWWLAGHTSPVSGHEALHDAAVVRGTTGLNSALWSLQWEVIFSLLLPVFVLSLVRWRQTPPLKLVLLFSLVVASPHSGHTSLLYLPIFGLGVVMAQQSRRLDWAGQAFDRLRQAPEMRSGRRGPAAPHRQMVAGAARRSARSAHRWAYPDAWGCVRCRVAVRQQRHRVIFRVDNVGPVAGQALIQPLPRP